MTKNHFFISLALLLGSIAVSAQDKKVAVFDPAGSVDNAIKEIVREEISNVIVNSEGFTVLERQLINKVLEENKFQQGGLVDDSQISEIGKRMGANYVFVTNITPLGTNYYVSCKMIEVMTARIEKQKTAQTAKGANDLIQVTQRLVDEMFLQKKNEVSQETKNVLPVNVNTTLVADGKKVYQAGRLLEKNEVRNLLVNTDALRLYETGLSQYNKGNSWLTTGIICTIVGISGAAVGLMEVGVEYNMRYDDYGSSYMEEDYTVPYILSAGGLIMAGAGIVFDIVGISNKISGKKKIRSAVDTYNRTNNHASNTELEFGFTPNGVGLVFRF